MKNKDLVWDLDKFNRKQHAQNFVMGFENKLCVYSGSVEQLYTNYNIFFPKEENRKLVILPNPYAHHDTFHGIPEAAARPTGLLLVPADPNDPRGRLNMVIPLKRVKAEYRKVPLEVGLNLINRKRPPDRPFLPVLVKGDLRELDTETPCLHMHSLVLTSMGRMSEMALQDIRKVILARLEDLASRQ
ncbi:MAG: hypothetical protein ACI9Y1_002127 [Lentisphaeria bacterium]|jgi:hypothetical protein